MNKWMILIVGTDKIFIDFYKNDPKFNKYNYKFFNVSNKKIECDDIDVINSYELEKYDHLGYPYAESEVIYNIFKYGLFKEYDYIGIIHYDFNLYNKKHDTYRITENINNIIDAGYDYISFQNMNLGYIYKHANIMLDERDRNCVFPQFSQIKNPVTAFDYTFEHLNRIRGSNISIDNFNMNSSLNMCCSFLMKRNIFDELGKLISSMIDEHHMDKFDDKKINRIPGNVIERTIGIFSLLHEHFEFDLDHKHITSDEFRKNGTLKNTIRY